MIMINEKLEDIFDYKLRKAIMGSEDSISKDLITIPVVSVNERTPLRKKKEEDDSHSKLCNKLYSKHLF